MDVRYSSASRRRRGRRWRARRQPTGCGWCWRTVWRGPERAKRCSRRWTRSACRRCAWTSRRRSAPRPAWWTRSRSEHAKSTWRAISSAARSGLDELRCLAACACSRSRHSNACRRTGASAPSRSRTPRAKAAPVTVRIAGREVGRGLAAPGSAATIPLTALGPGWWPGEATLDPDELRADDRRLFVWRVAPPANVGASPNAGAFVSAALAVLEDGRRIRPGSDVFIGDRPASGSKTSIVMPPADAALLGEVNRALAERGSRWRFGPAGTPGPVTGPVAPGGTPVGRRYRLDESGQPPTAAADSVVLARVNGEPWLVRDGSVMLIGSRLDTGWTALPATPGFVPFVDALVNRLARSEAQVGEAEGTARVEFRTRGTDTLGATVFGLDPRESDLTPAAAGLTRDVLGAEVLEDAAFAAARFAGTGRSDVSGLLLALALLLALVELGVATLSH